MTPACDAFRQPTLSSLLVSEPRAASSVFLALAACDPMLQVETRDKALVARSPAEPARPRRRGDRMRRREFITVLGGAAAWPLAAHAQQPAMPVIGFLSSESPDLYARPCARVPPRPERNRLCRGPQRRDRISLGGRPKRSTAGLAADLVRRQVTVIAANSPAACWQQRRRPRPFRSSSPPGRPGRSWTCRQPEPTGRQPHRRDHLERGARAEAAGAAARVGARRRPVIALLVNPTAGPLPRPISRDLQAAARTLGLQLHVLHASTERDFDTVFATLAQLRAGGLVIGSDPFFNSRSEQLAALAVRHAVPAIYQYREFAAAGGLMSYGGSLTDMYRQVGVYTGRILKGEKPADLPVQQSTKVELIINLKTAKALGLTVPLSLLARADEVIE